MKVQTRNYLFNYLTIILVLLFTFFFLRVYLAPGMPLNTFTWIGLALLAPSILLFTIARIQLGSAFQASAEANKLVKTGLYSKIRHPVYLFGLTFLLGIIFIIQKFPLLIFCAIIIFIQIRRIRREEKVLAEKFGDEYLEYKKHTWF